MDINQEVKEYAGDDLPFGQWLQKVENICGNIFYMSIFDFVDMPWYDFFEECRGQPPIEDELVEFMAEHDELIGEYAYLFSHLFPGK